MVDYVKDLQNQLRDAVHAQISQLVVKNKIEEFKEEYDEETKTWTFEIVFNEGDDRTMKVKLDINPDGKPE